MPHFASLASGLSLVPRHGSADLDVQSVTADSRRVSEGDVFVAIPGVDRDGHQYLGAAVDAGASVLVIDAARELPADLSGPAAVFATEDPRGALAHLVRRLHGEPDRALKVVAVTGTNGKTSVAHLCRDLMQSRGERSGLLGTIGYHTGGPSQAASLTTPGPEQLFGLLHEMVDGGLTACCLEASSHALAQARLGAMEVDVAVYTNLTRDHLDYHADHADYFRAKLKLLERLSGSTREKPTGRAVVWIDDATFAGHDWPADTVRVGRHEDAHVQLRSAAFHRHGTDLKVRIDRRTWDLESPLLGGFNVDNLLLALGAGYALGMGGEALAAAVPSFSPVPGRLDPVALAEGPLCIVDYAHTPDGIQSALRACRHLTEGSVTLVFGCGGDRDRGKRPLMAQAAAGADHIVVTTDNPRSEDPAVIFADIEAGFDAGVSYQVVPDRAEAIATALHRATPSDVVLVAGKGHESYQILATGTEEWSDHRAIRQGWEARP